MQTIAATRLYAVTDTVLVSGVYVCVPCGYTQYFEAGSRFIECLACLAGTENGPLGFQSERDEFWRYLG